MYGFKTLAKLNSALYEAGLGRLQLTEDEWMFGIDSKTAYTHEYLGVAAALDFSKTERVARLAAKANRPTLTAWNYR